MKELKMIVDLMQIIFRILRHKPKTQNNTNFVILLYSWLPTLFKKTSKWLQVVFLAAH